VFPKFLTGFQLGLRQLWSHLWCGILDALVQQSTGEFCEMPQACEQQSRNTSYSSLCGDVCPVAPGLPVLAVLLCAVEFPEAAQTLLWADCEGSSYREGQWGLRRLRNAVLRYQQCRRQLHSSLCCMALVRHRSQFTSASCRNADGLKFPVSAQDSQHFRSC